MVSLGESSAPKVTTTSYPDYMVTLLVLITIPSKTTGIHDEMVLVMDDIKIVQIGKINSEARVFIDGSKRSIEKLSSFGDRLWRLQSWLEMVSPCRPPAGRIVGETHRMDTIGQNDNPHGKWKRERGRTGGFF